MVSSKPKEVVVPSFAEAPIWHDPRGVEYVTNPDVLYLTTDQLAKELDMYRETVYRWCSKWFGDLPKGRTGAKMGYRIPQEYLKVGRAWLQTEDPRLREVLRRAIVAAPRNWVVAVANVGSTHYSDAEVVGRVESLTKHSTYRGQTISVIYVGDE